MQGKETRPVFSTLELGMLSLPIALAAIWIFGAFLCIRLLLRNRRRPLFVIFTTYALSGAAITVGWITLMCFWATLRGNPSLGKVEANHYFVGQHGGYHEVSPQTYFRLEHAQALIEKAAWWWFLLLPVGLMAAIVEFGWKRAMRKLVLGPNRPPADELQSKKI